MMGAVFAGGGRARGIGVEGKIKGHSAIEGVSHCLHIFFWGTAPKDGGAMVLCKTRAKCRFYGGAIVYYARKTPQLPTFKQYVRI